jgi:hypothetical protein
MSTPTLRLRLGASGSGADDGATHDEDVEQLRHVHPLSPREREGQHSCNVG